MGAPRCPQWAVSLRVLATGPRPAELALWNPWINNYDHHRPRCWYRNAASDLKTSGVLVNNAAENPHLSGAVPCVKGPPPLDVLLALRRDSHGIFVDLYQPVGMKRGEDCVPFVCFGYERL